MDSTSWIKPSACFPTQQDNRFATNTEWFLSRGVWFHNHVHPIWWQTKVNKSPQISTGQFLRGTHLKAFVAPPSKRALGPSEEFTLLILTTLAAGLNQEGCGFTQKPGDPFRSRFSPIPSFRPIPIDSFGTKQLLCSGNITRCFFQGYHFHLFSPQPFPDFSGPFRGITLRVGPAAFKGHSRLEWTPFFTHPKLTSLFLGFGNFCSDSFWRFWRIPGGGDTQSSSFHSRSCFRRHTQGQLFSFSLQMFGVDQDRLCCWQLIQVQLLADHVETICHLWGFPLKTSVHLAEAPSKTKPSGKVTWSSMALWTNLRQARIQSKFSWTLEQHLESVMFCDKLARSDAPPAWKVMHNLYNTWSVISFRRFELTWFLLWLDQG